MALPDEASCIYQGRCQQHSPIQIQPGIHLCLSGIGYDNALNAAAALIKSGANALVCWGIAGALDETMHSGDLLIADEIISVKKRLPCTSDWQQKLLENLTLTDNKVISGQLYSDNHMCVTAQDKQRLHAECGAIVADMESAAVAGLAAELGHDFVCLRAIADEAVTSLPRAVTHHTDELGKPKPIRFALSCLSQPTQVASLLILARAYQKAILSLNEIAIDLKNRSFLYNTATRFRFKPVKKT